MTLHLPPSDMLSVTTYSFCFPSINNKLQQPEAAAGVLEYAMKHFGELVSCLIPFRRARGSHLAREALSHDLKKVTFLFCFFANC